MKPTTDSVKECFAEIKTYLKSKPKDEELLTLIDKAIEEYQLVRNVAEYMSELVTSLQTSLQKYQSDGAT